MKGNGTEVGEADGVPLPFKMKTSPQSFALKRNYQSSSEAKQGKATILHKIGYNDQFLPLKITSKRICAKRTYNPFYVT